MARPTERTIKRLFAVSGNRCAFPGCAATLVTGTTVTGEICHIKAQGEGGPRYDPDQSDKECHALENLLLLCGDHHKIVDADPAIYTVERLREIKAKNEARHAEGVEPSDNVVQRLLANVRIEGDVSGQVAIGHNVIQIGEISGKGASVMVNQIQPLPPSRSSYVPPPLPARWQIPEPGDLPPGSRVPFARNRLFTGRSSFLRDTAHVLLDDTVDPAPAAVAVAGEGGIGKTQVAIKLAWRTSR